MTSPAVYAESEQHCCATTTTAGAVCSAHALSKVRDVANPPVGQLQNETPVQSPSMQLWLGSGVVHDAEG